MKTNSIWGNHSTSRWEFNTKSKKSDSTLADNLLSGKDIKKQNNEDRVETIVDINIASLENKILSDISNSGDNVFKSNFEMLLAASLDLIDGDISLEDFKTIVEQWVD